MTWQCKRLEEVADFCLGKMLDQKKNRGELRPYLANVNVRWGSFDLNDLREMRFEDSEDERYGLKYGDIVMCEGGEPGRCAIWKDERPGMMVQKALHRIRSHDGLDHRFLYYTFVSKGRTGELSGLFTGATIKHLPREKLAKVQIPIPPMATQERVAELLSSYDDLIANNRRRIALLEEAAHLMYREWFVHLRFPGHEHVKVANGVPEGWDRTTLVEACASLEDGDWIETKDQGGSDYRLLQISNIGVNAFVETGHYRFITEQTFVRLNCRELLPEHILIARMPKPIGRAWLVTESPWKMITAVDGAIAVTDPERADPYFLTYFINSPANLALCERRAVGATRPRVTRRDVASLPLTLPPLRLQKHFREVVEPLNQQRQRLQRQSDKLAEARDLLLPRLMNGEITV